MQEVSGQRSFATADKFVSCLCVTEGRPAFMPWLLWNYRKQDYPFRELVVVDGTDSGPSIPCDPDIRVIRCAPGLSVGQKRNIALEHAAGALIAWFDDDDWQHPQRLSSLVERLGDGAGIAGPTASWFVDLARLRARPYGARRLTIFNGALFRRTTIGDTRFDEARRPATDTTWLAKVLSTDKGQPHLHPTALAFWLCHETNISNPASRRTFPLPLRRVIDSVGSAAWSTTSSELIGLQQRLSLSAGPNDRPRSVGGRVAFPSHAARQR